MTYPNLQLNIAGVWRSLCDLEIKSLSQQEANQRPGTLSIAYELSEDLGLVKNDRLSLRIQTSDADAEGTVLFVGKVTARAVDQEQSVSITVSNVFDDLEHIVFETDTILGADKYSPSHLTLYRDQNADPITIGQQIKLALDFAITQGSLLSYTQAELDALDIYMPAAEAIDLTVAEVIKKSLAYRPDIIVAVEYSGSPTDPQRLRFAPRDGLPSTVISTTEDPLQFSAIARYDLQVDGVILYYYWTEKYSGGSVANKNQVDSYGTVSGVNIVKQTIPLKGLDASSSIQLELLKIPSLLDSAETRAKFWWSAADRAGIYTGSLIFTDPYSWADLIINDSYSPTGGTHIILKSLYDTASEDFKNDVGQIWEPGCYCDQFYFVRTQTTSSYINNFRVAIAAASNFAPFYSFIPKPVNSYGSIPGDIVPINVAEQLYSILNPLQYDGNVVRFDDLRTPAGICSILRKLNIADSSDDLTTMNSLIQTCSMDYMTSRQTLKFGPANHLEPKDFISLIRTNRSRNFSLIFPYA